LSACDFFKLSDEEALLITGTHTVDDAARALMKKSAAVFAITLGKDGTLLRIADKTIVVPVNSVKAVDTTGAGDAFVGAVLYQLRDKNRDQVNMLTEEQWTAIASNANKAGARTCEYFGAMEAFKHLSGYLRCLALICLCFAFLVSRFLFLVPCSLCLFLVRCSLFLVHLFICSIFNIQIDPPSTNIDSINTSSTTVLPCRHPSIWANAFLPSL
jgi:hypothetical protein